MEIVDYDDGLVDQVRLGIDQGFSIGGDGRIQDVFWHVEGLVPKPRRQLGAIG
jgi:hypothetical protein